MKVCEGVHQMVIPCISPYVQWACACCWVHNSFPSLRRGYCWVAVGWTASRPTPDNWQHQAHSG